MTTATDGLAGKVVIITGAARGQGEAGARLLAARGAKVVITDVLEAEGARVAADIGDDALFVPHDVSDPAAWARVAEAATAAFGGVDALVNNAAILKTRPLLEETAENVDRFLKINFFGAFHGMQTVAPLLIARGGGSIVNVCSLAGLQGIPGYTAYGASKWALRGVSRTAAVELGEHGVRVNAVFPGAVDTAMTAGVTRGFGNYPSVPLRRVGEPRDVAELVAFLVSDASSWITGSEFVIDGGSTAGITPKLPPAETV